MSSNGIKRLSFLEGKREGPAPPLQESSKTGKYNNKNNNPTQEESVTESTTGNSINAENNDVDSILASLGDLSKCRRLTLVREGTRHYRHASGPSGNPTTKATKAATAASTTNPNNIHGLLMVQHKWAVVRNPFPVAALAAIMKMARKLVCLEVCRVRLEGDMDDFEAWADAIEHNNSCNDTYFRAFSLEHCRLNNKDLLRQQHTSPLESVVKALAHSPVIGDITLIADKDRNLGTLSVQTLELLGTSPTLLVLRLDKMGLKDEEMTALAYVIKRNEALRTLKLSCNGIGYLGSCAMVKMLENNCGSLEKVHIILDRLGDEEATIRLARALQSAQSLKHYELGFGPKVKLSPKLQQVHAEVNHSKVLAKEIEFGGSSTRFSNCPFIRLFQHGMNVWCGDEAGAIYTCDDVVHHQQHQDRGFV